MSGTPEDLDLLAAEYVLGALDAATARDIAARSQTEPALRAAIAAWQERLEPLTLLAAPAAPPPSLWHRIATTTGATTGVTTGATTGAKITGAPVTGAGSGEAAPGLLARAWRSVLLWRSATAVGFAVAAALIAFILLRAPAQQFVAALVPAGHPAAAFVAELQRDGSLRLVALESVSVPRNKDLELWALPEGASHPIPIGLVPPTGTRLAPPRMPPRNAKLMISLEPSGGSPTGLPTGPVLFAGALTGAHHD